MKMTNKQKQHILNIINSIDQLLLNNSLEDINEVLNILNIKYCKGVKK